MASKRAPSGGGSSSSPPPIVTALLLVGAVGWSIGLLVRKGMVTWPPTHLLSCLATIAGGLALVGPFILSRTGRGGGGLGELLWLTGGILIWIFNIVAIAGGNLKSVNWATPLGERAMGLIMLAVLLAGLRAGLAGRDWSWTNVTGWALGLFWVGLALATWVLAPESGLGAGLVSR